MAQAQTTTARPARLSREVIAAEALRNATENASMANYPAIFAGFEAMGITDIQPRINIFTYQAWLKLGRQVRRGESGVKVATFVNAKNKTDSGEPAAGGYKFARGVSVFHVSQTDPVEAKA